MAHLAADFPAYDALIEAGYTTTGKIEKASDEDLLAVPGVGAATLTKIREATKESDVIEKETPATGVFGGKDVPPAHGPSFACAGPLCGHSITAYPCPYCGFSA